MVDMSSLFKPTVEMEKLKSKENYAQLNFRKTLT